MRVPRLRRSEWIVLAFFVYLVLLIPIFRDRPALSLQPIILLAVVAAIVVSLALAERTRYARTVSMLRDWLPMGLTLCAFRAMEYFVPREYNHHLETAWIRWDDQVLAGWGLQKMIEALTPVLPTYFEFCYLLVYGVGTFCISVLWIKAKREEVDRFYIVLLTGTLLAYAMFPYFPSRPPRIVFPHVAAPATHDVFRRFNLFLLRKATIHTGVFPSAHVSAAFAAAWAMFLVLPKQKRFGWGLVFYATSVACATVYGRYHYLADAIAGFCVSLAAAAVALYLWRNNNSPRDCHPARADTHLVA